MCEADSFWLPSISTACTEIIPSKGPRALRGSPQHTFLLSKRGIQMAAVQHILVTCVDKYVQCTGQADIRGCQDLGFLENHAGLMQRYSS